MKKFWAILLILWPYLLIPFMLVMHILSDGASKTPELLIYCCCTPVVYIANIICACRTKDPSSLVLWNMLMKLLHIPSYALIFLLGVMLTGQLIVGSPLGLIIVPILIAIDVLLLCTTSSYGINALVKAKKKNRISKVFMVVNIVLHLIFVWDVISSVIVFFKIRQAKPAE